MRSDQKARSPAPAAPPALASTIHGNGCEAVRRGPRIVTLFRYFFLIPLSPSCFRRNPRSVWRYGSLFRIHSWPLPQFWSSRLRVQSSRFKVQEFRAQRFGQFPPIWPQLVHHSSERRWKLRANAGSPCPAALVLHLAAIQHQASGNQFPIDPHRPIIPPFQQTCPP